jgi:SpoVK/Ycf46/Vps4 family AAA+-type ATPase
MPRVAEISIAEDDFVHLARLALTGRRQDVHLFLLRLLRRYRESLPAVADQISALLRDSPTRDSPLRSDGAVAVPVDLDSRLHLVRHDLAPSLSVEPVWAESIRAQLTQIVSERQHEEALLSAGLTPTRTVLLTGVPGVGKSLAAHWLARELKRPLLTLDLAAVMSSFLGRTGSNVRHVLDYAKNLSCILLLDEFDAVAKRRDDLHEVGELKRLVTVLLQEIDDWPPTGLLLAATNHPTLLDPAVWRRFETVMEFPLPDDRLLREAVESFLGPHDGISSLWQDILAALFAGRSFSDVERSLLQVRREAITRNQKLETVLESLIQTQIADRPRAVRRRIAHLLCAKGHSQRSIQRLTGVSRDTLRIITKSPAVESMRA